MKNNMRKMTCQFGRWEQVFTVYAGHCTTFVLRDLVHFGRFLNRKWPLHKHELREVCVWGEILIFPHNIIVGSIQNKNISYCQKYSLHEYSK